MRAKLVVRLLDASGTLLAWAPLRGEARGDRKLWAMEPGVGYVERTGVGVTVSVQWADLNVQRRFPISPRRVTAGEAWTVEFPTPNVAWEFASDEGPLPPVVERRPVAVPVPVGALSQ